MTITESPQPSPRTNFSLTTLPSGELLLFGGEYYDGEDTIVYNGVFRYEKMGGAGKGLMSWPCLLTSRMGVQTKPQVAPRARGMAKD